jgi:uncharacterized Zn finger protein
MSALPGNSQNRSTFQRRSETPRKVRGGIKLAGTLFNPSTEEEAGAGVELARRFQALWEAAVDRDSAAPGREYAKAGQVVDVDVRAGIIESHVQGTMSKPYLVQLHMPVFDEQQWSRAIEAMSGEAVYVAKLLAGELPAAIHDRLKQSGVDLLPESADAVRATCTCAAATARTDAPGSACKHVAAAAYVAAERLAENPLLIFTLLGAAPQHVLEQLRQARAGHVKDEGGPSQELMLSDSTFHAPPLEACIDEFWRSPLRQDEWNHLQDPVSRHYVPHALLRRLGPSPMSGRFPLVGLLASVYDAASAAAARLRPSADQPDLTGTGPTN